VLTAPSTALCDVVNHSACLRKMKNLSEHNGLVDFVVDFVKTIGDMMTEK